MATQYNSQPTSLVDTCMAVKCDSCGKTTWKGCGRHVDQVMASVPKEDQCACPRS